jgi:hypothetical protein
MKRLFHSAQSIEVHSLRDLLSRDGVPAAVVNDPGFLVGEGIFAMPEGDFEVWVNDEDLVSALQVKQDWISHRTMNLE